MARPVNEAGQKDADWMRVVEEHGHTSVAMAPGTRHRMSVYLKLSSGIRAVQ